MERIELNKSNQIKSNYKGYLPIDIAAFSFAAAGAMGEHGGVVIVGSDAQVYHLNYVYGEWDSFDDIIEICPILRVLYLE